MDFTEIQPRRRARAAKGRLSEGWPIDNYSLNPVRAAVYAKETGRVVSFSLACFRQVFAAGRDMSDVGERADRSGLRAPPPTPCSRASRLVGQGRLRAATDEALALGVEGILTVALGDRLWGDDRLEGAGAPPKPDGSRGRSSLVLRPLVGVG